MRDDVTDSEVLAELPDFVVFRKDRKQTRGGGVLIAVNEQLSCSLINIHCKLEILWLVCRAVPETVLLGVCYRPPDNNPDFAQDLNDILNQLTTKYSTAHILLFGDFNFPDIDWNDANQLITGHSRTKEFINVCLNFNLTQLITEPTRISGETSNILDLILTTKPDSLSYITLLPEISDHKVIYAVFEFVPELRKACSKTIRLYDKGDYSAIVTELEAFLPHFETTLSERSVNDNWLIFEDKIKELTNKFIPSTTFRSNHQKPWFSKLLKRLENKKKRLFRAAKRAATASSWGRYKEAETFYYNTIQTAK